MLTEIGSIFPKGCSLAGVGIGSTRPSPFEDIGFAKLDHHRPLRAGLPWVVLASGKLPEQLAKIILRMAESGVNVLATCADPRAFTAARQRLEHFHRYCNADIALSHPSCARMGHPNLTLSVKMLWCSGGMNPENRGLARIAISLWILPLRQAQGQNDAPSLAKRAGVTQW